MQAQQQNQYPRPNLTVFQLRSQPSFRPSLMIAHNVMACHEGQHDNATRKLKQQQTGRESTKDDGVGLPAKFGIIKKNKVSQKQHQLFQLNRYYNNNSEDEQQQAEDIQGQEICLKRNQSNQKLKEVTQPESCAKSSVAIIRQQEQDRLLHKFGLLSHPPENGHSIPGSNNSDLKSCNENDNAYHNYNRGQPQSRHRLPEPQNSKQFVDSRNSQFRSLQSKYGPGGVQTLQFNPEKEKLIILDSKETENNMNGLNGMLNQFCENIQIPTLEVLPDTESAPEELVAIAKNILGQFGCKISDQTVITVRKYRNCVYFGVDSENNLLYHFDNGKLYYGGWKAHAGGEGEKCGQGVEILPGRYKFQGYFLDGRKFGIGTLINSDGSAYVGQWENGVRHGRGRQLDVDGTVYQGEWKQGKKSGYGKILMEGRLQFEGVFSKGLKNGYGKQYFDNGDEYDGNYVNNKFEGKGTYSWKSGASYTGSFRNGKRNGTGEWKSGDNDFDSYRGEYLDDMKHGYGVYKWCGGAVYEGEFKNDVKHGQGTIMYENGKVAHLVWKNGKVQKKATPHPGAQYQGLQQVSNGKALTRNRCSNSQAQLHVLESQVHIQSQSKQKSNNVVFRSRVSSRSTQNLHSAASSNSSSCRSFAKGLTFHTNSLNRVKGNTSTKNNSSMKGLDKAAEKAIKLKFEDRQLQKSVGRSWNRDLFLPTQNRQQETANRPDLPKDRPYQGIQNSGNIPFQL